MPLDLISIAEIAGIGYTAARAAAKGGANAAMANAPIPPHLKPNAVILSDDAIIAMEVPMLRGMSNIAKWKTGAQGMLQIEQIDVPELSSQCQSGGHYKGQPLAVTALKDGSFALGAITGIASGVHAGLGSAGGLFGTGFAATGSLAAQAVPIIGTAIGLGLALFTMISAHHKAAVGTEQGKECQLIPPANQTLTVIEQAFMNGVIDAKTAQGSLEQLHLDFLISARGGKIDPVTFHPVGGGGPDGSLSEAPCNALCWYGHFLHVIVIKKQNRYSQYIR